MPPRGPLATMSTLAAEGQRQYIKSDGMDWAAKSRPAPPSSRRYHLTGETVPSRRHNQTDSESGKEANEADTEEVPVSLLFFGSVGYSGNELVIRQCCSQVRMDSTFITFQRLSVDEAIDHGVVDGLGDAVGVEFLKDAFAVAFRRVKRLEHQPGDFLGSVAHG